MTLFSPSVSDALSQQLPQGSGHETATNGFPSVTSVFQHLVFKMFFHDVLFTAPSPSPGVMRKSFLFFKEALLIIVQACAKHIPYSTPHYLDGNGEL